MFELWVIFKIFLTPGSSIIQITFFSSIDLFRVIVVQKKTRRVHSRIGNFQSRREDFSSSSQPLDLRVKKTYSIVFFPFTRGRTRAIHLPPISGKPESSEKSKPKTESENLYDNC